MGLCHAGVGQSFDGSQFRAISAVLPIYFICVLCGSVLVIGVMKGLADFAASSLDLVSGYFSDQMGRRNGLAWFGYAILVFDEFILVRFVSVKGVIAFRLINRLGKSVRGAPRDAMLASPAPKGRRGFPFGLHKALDKAVEVIRPFVAYLVFSLGGESRETFDSLFLISLIPAILAFKILWLAVKDCAPTPHSKRGRIRETWKALGRPFKDYILSSAAFSLEYFSFAFLALKGQSVGLSLQDQALLYGLFNLVFTITSLPIGWMGDRVGQKNIVVISYLMYIAMAIGFMISETTLAVSAMVVVSGVFYAMNEGQTKAYLWDLTEEANRAPAIVIYGFVTGLAYHPSSLVAGALWPLGPMWAFAFAFAIGTTVVALAMFLSTPVRMIPAE